MNWNKSLFAFTDVQEAFDKALGAAKGIRVTCPTRGEAVALRSRFNYFRKMNRAMNAATYPEDHHMHGRSPYDSLVLRIPAKGGPDEAILFIQHRSIDDLMIEELL